LPLRMFFACCIVAFLTISQGYDTSFVLRPTTCKFNFGFVFPEIFHDADPRKTKLLFYFDSSVFRRSFKLFCLSFRPQDLSNFLLTSIFNLQVCDGPSSGSYGVSRSLHRRHGAVRVFWIEWDIWSSSEEAAGVARLFQRRGTLEKLVLGLVLRALGEGPAPRGAARDGQISKGNPRVEFRVYGFIFGKELGTSRRLAGLCLLLNLILRSIGPQHGHTPSHRFVLYSFPPSF